MEAQNVNIEPIPATAAAPVSVWARIAAIPMVADATAKVCSMYASVKDYSENTKCICTRVEETSAAAYNYIWSTKIANAKIAPQIPAVEKFVAEQLDKLETAYPIVKAPTEEVISSAKEAAQPAVDAVYAKVAPLVELVNTTTAGAA